MPGQTHTLSFFRHSQKLSLKNLIKEHKNGNAKTDSASLQKYEKEFLNAINDDLNIPLAIGVMFTMLKDLDFSKEVYNLALKFDKALGLELDKEEKENKSTIPNEIVELAKLRLNARRNKDYKKSDEIRDEILKRGFVIKDTKDGFEIEKKN